MMNGTKLFVALVACGMLFAAMPGSQANAQDEDGTPAGVLNAVLNWIPNLVVDVGDIFDANVAVGEGNALDVRFTRLAQVGYASYDVTRYGLNGREGFEVEDATEEAGASILGVELGDVAYDPYDIGVTLNVVAGGVELSGNVRALADAFLQLIFIDLEGDNKTYIE
jgi:hypothetical protein